MRRSPFTRFLTLAWASLQLAAPGLSAIADGRLSLEQSSRPTTHVEATSSESCPVVHSPDCAVCRYLSQSAPQVTAPAILWSESVREVIPETAAGATCNATVALPHGRAPPQA